LFLNQSKKMHFFRPSLVTWHAVVLMKPKIWILKRTVVPMYGRRTLFNQKSSTEPLDHAS
jgi:hypothetical protein